MAPRPCIVAGCRGWAVRGGSRCASHQRQAERAKRAKRPGYDRAERARRKRAVDAHIAAYGLVCPGWQRPPHAVAEHRDLSADHVWAVAAGGPEGGPLVVLCVSCNASRGARGG